LYTAADHPSSPRTRPSSAGSGSSKNRSTPANGGSGLTSATASKGELQHMRVPYHKGCKTSKHKMTQTIFPAPAFSFSVFSFSVFHVPYYLCQRSNYRGILLTINEVVDPSQV
jgi:hypothetical protein